MALALYAGAYTPYRFLPALLAATVQIFLTGALHTDGLGDTFDGLFCNKGKERMLEIMRDSRIGTNGAAAILVSVLVKVLLLTEVMGTTEGWTPFLAAAAMPAVGKIGILTAAASCSYARPEGGLGKAFIEGIRLRHLLMGMGFLVLLLGWFFGPLGPIHMLLPIVTAALFTVFVKGRIGGMTGDTLGAANEIAELTFLVFFLNLSRVILG
jgi:adenosylcobinamide-GDP ribazoletransferase